MARKLAQLCLASIVTMSVYSGFATRMQESQYNGLLCKLISLFEKRVVSSLHSDFFDSDQWNLSFRSVFKAMRKMESQKYLPPKFSHYCKDLAEQLGAYVRVQVDSNVARLFAELQPPFLQLQ